MVSPCAISGISVCKRERTVLSVRFFGKVVFIRALRVAMFSHACLQDNKRNSDLSDTSVTAPPVLDCHWESHWKALPKL